MGFFLCGMEVSFFSIFQNFIIKYKVIRTLLLHALLYENSIVVYIDPPCLFIKNTSVNPSCDLLSLLTCEGGAIYFHNFNVINTVMLLYLIRMIASKISRIRDSQTIIRILENKM